MELALWATGSAEELTAPLMFELIGIMATTDSLRVSCMIGGAARVNISSQIREWGGKAQKEREEEKHCDVTYSPVLWDSERKREREGLGEEPP